MRAKVLSAAFFGVTSLLITIVNKSVLTIFSFPSYLVLSLGQLTAVVVILQILHWLKVIKLQRFSKELIWKIQPLPFFYVGAIVLGLGGTQAVNLPMFVELRKLTILITMVLEYWTLNIRPVRSTQVVVFIMLVGSVIAMSDDLTFSPMGYTLILVSNLVTALNNVYIKKKFSVEKIDSYDLLYYSSVISILPITLLIAVLGHFQLVMEYRFWNDWQFVTQFLLSCVMGFLLNYAIVTCTKYNSAFTTTIVGCMKNILITYFGMFLMSDYMFSWINFIGLNISVVSSCLYIYVEFFRKNRSEINIKTEVA